MKHESNITVGIRARWLCGILVLQLSVASLLVGDEKSPEPSQIPAGTNSDWAILKARAGKSNYVEFKGRTLFKKKICWLKIRLDRELALTWVASIERSCGKPITPLEGQFSAAYGGIMSFHDGDVEIGRVRFLNSLVGFSLNGDSEEKWFDWNQKSLPATESLDALLGKAEKGKFEVLAISYNMYRKPW